MPTIVAALLIWLVGSFALATVFGKLTRVRAPRHRLDAAARAELSYWSQIDLNPERKIWG